jgi:hypothetical protein
MAQADPMKDPASDGGQPDDKTAPGLRERPPGPVADVSTEITGSKDPFIGAAGGLGLPDGYVDHEYVAAGMATSYKASAPLTADGRWKFAPDTTAAYRTRVLVRTPVDIARASGTVIFEWLNVSGGIDADPEYASLAEEIARKGHIWIGVSAQLIGIEGGSVLVKAPGPESDMYAGKGLKTIDPERYGSLQHPGDGFSFDIFTQVARAVLEGGPVVRDATVNVMLAAGESQSAFALTTYYNGVQPLTRIFDGFLLHSRGATSLSLVGPGMASDLLAALAGGTTTTIRDDVREPLLDLQSESDLRSILNSYAARQPDNDRFRLWEVAGTAHADVHLLGPTLTSLDCGVPINNGPMHIVAKAALRALETWVRAAQLPPVAPRVEVGSGFAPAIMRNSDGIALGGIRTPPVDVPVDALTGDPGPTGGVLCLLLGSSKPLSDARLAELYPSGADYMQQYNSATDRAIQSGFVLADDRDALLGFAQPSRVKP